jgi:peptide/nickel transport system substrate-binding protein
MEPLESVLSTNLCRRTALRLLGTGGALALAAACGAPTPPQAAGAIATNATPLTAQPAPAPTRAASTSVAQATPVATTAAEPSGSLRVAYADLQTQLFDPTSAQFGVALYMVYEPLLRYDQQGNLIPWLADSYSMSPDGKLWTFNLRKDAKWTNGDPFTSDDVKFSLERYISPDAKNAWSPAQRQTVDRIEAPDKNTVNVYAKGVDVFYPDALTGLYIHSKSYFEKVGADAFANSPMGTGPLKLTKLTPGSTAELEANTDYWGTKTAWAKLVLSQVVEESTKIAMLKRQEIDIIGVSNDNAVALRDAGFQLRQTKVPTIPGFFIPGYWMSPGPTSDVRVRQALSTAINRQEIVDSFFKGFGKPGAGNIGLTELHWGFDPVWYSDTYDPSASKQLLQDAGYPDKFEDPVVRVFSTVQRAFGWEPDFMQVLSGYFEAVGIKTQLIPIDYTTMRSGWIGKDPKLMGGVVPYMGLGSAANDIAGQQNHWTTAGVNLGGNDRAIDQLFSDMRSELDLSKRTAVWQSIQQKAHALYSVIGTVRVFDQYAVSDQVGDWTGLDYLPFPLELGLAGVQHK